MTINPNNYPGVTATIVGTAGSPAENPAYDKSGERGFQQIRVAVNEGYKDKQSGEWVDKGVTWYTVTDRAETFADLAIQAGDRIRVDEARLETREFDRKDGSKGQAFETRFGTLSVVQRKSGGAPAQQSYSDDSPF